jgi:hypothetical protein
MSLRIPKLDDVLSDPFLLIQIGNYGKGYQWQPIPRRLVPAALERQKRGDLSYPTNPLLPYPHFHVPGDVRGILVNKVDELRINGFAYWAQALGKRIHRRNCINSSPDELLRFSSMIRSLWAVLITQKTTTTPKGNTPGQIFERWTPEGYRPEPPTAQINTDIVYTEAGKTTLVFTSLEVMQEPEPIDLNRFHVYFTDRQFQGRNLPYRPSMYGTCSLLEHGSPEQNSEIPPLKPESASRHIVAVACLHPHVCGRVRKARFE